jgi:hypothetical protein
VTWNDKADGSGNNHSALLVSDATTMSQFCYACHGESAPGASTNVMTGIFDAGPSSPAGGAAIGSPGRDGVVIAYQTASSYDATLNGGGFLRVPLANGSSYVSATSAHDMDPASAVPMWGAGSGVDKQVKIISTSNVSSINGPFDFCLSYDAYLDQDQAIMDNSLIMFLHVLMEIGVKQLALAGFDGFAANSGDNYYDEQIDMHATGERLHAVNVAIQRQIQVFQKDMDITFLTRSIYEGNAQ